MPNLLSLALIMPKLSALTQTARLQLEHIHPLSLPVTYINIQFFDHSQWSRGIMKMKYKAQLRKKKYGTTATMERRQRNNEESKKSSSSSSRTKRSMEMCVCVCVERRNRWTDPSGIIEIRRNVKTASERSVGCYSGVEKL